MAVNNKTKYLLKNTGILGISMFSSKVLVFFLVPLYTAVLSTAEYGTYDLAVTTTQLLYPILTLNIAEAVMRFLMDKDANKQTIIGFSLRVVMLASVIMAALLFGNSYLKIWNDIHGLEGYILFYYISYILHNWLSQTAKGLEKIKCMGISGVIGTVAMILLNVLFLLVFKTGLQGFFVANALGQLIPAVYIALDIHIWKYARFKKDTALQTQMLRYCVPMILVAVGWWANSSINKYVVTWICGAAANGLLSVAYKIPTILSTFQQIFIQAWQVSAVKEYEDKGSYSFYRNTFVYLNAFMCVLCVALLIGNRLIAKILFADDFYMAWQYVPFLLLSSLLNAASGYIGAILIAQKNAKSITMSSIVGFATNLILSIVLVNLIGIQGAAVATAASSFVIYEVRRKYLSKDFFGKEYWMIIGSWIVLLFAAIAEAHLTSYVLTMLCLVTILIIYRQQIMQIWRMCCSMLKGVGHKGN